MSSYIVADDVLNWPPNTVDTNQHASRYSSSSIKSAKGNKSLAAHAVQFDYIFELDDRMNSIERPDLLYSDNQMRNHFDFDHIYIYMFTSSILFN